LTTDDHEDPRARARSVPSKARARAQLRRVHGVIAPRRPTPNAPPRNHAQPRAIDARPVRAPVS